MGEQLNNFILLELLERKKLGLSSRGAKSEATWQPCCQKAFVELGSGRKILDPSPAISHKKQFGGNNTNIFYKMSLFFIHFLHNIQKKSIQVKKKS